MNRHIDTESATFVSLMFLASRGSSFRAYFIFTSAGVVSAVKRSPNIIITQVIYLLVFWDHWAHSESL